jgi:hypothetical protein
MAYIRERFLSADKKILIVKKHHSLFAMPTKTKIKQRRCPKTNESEDDLKKRNERARREKYMRLLADNFHAGDFYLTLTTAEKMEPEEFKASMRGFMQRLRRDYSRRTGGEKLKFFRVMENLDGKGRPHAHLLIPQYCSPELIRGIMAVLWPEGHISVQIYGGTATDAYNISSYFTKESKIERAKIDTSRGNLIRREPKKTVIHAETFSDEIKAPKGYRVVKSLSYNTMTGSGAYQVAVFEKIERGNAYAIMAGGKRKTQTQVRGSRAKGAGPAA